MSAPTVLVVGGAAIDAGVGPAVVGLARATHTGVLNTWRAKGLFRFDDPAHLGTIGLQRDDLALAGVTEQRRAFGRVVVCGVGEGELPPGLAAGLPVDAEYLDPADLGTLAVSSATHWPQRPPLYDALAAVCGPAYGSDEVPLSPVRAAGDLAGWLAEHAVVVAGAGEPGFWLGRTFPTRAPGTVVLPARPDPRFTARVAATAVAGAVVVCGPGDAAPDPAGGRSWVVVERWLPDGPRLDPTERLAQLAAAAEAGGGVVEVGVALGDLSLLEDVAGPPVVWGGPAVAWGGGR